ncbi:MAG: hypothetical protein RLP44_11365 [Aggregatilineales bacterium]
MTPTTDENVRAFLIAAHGDLENTKRLLAEHPEWLDITYEWAENNTETPIQAAAHVGNRPIAEYLLEQGAPLAIYTAAMLGRRDDVLRMLADDPETANARGGHGIPLISHAAMSGDVAIMQAIADAGGDLSGASGALFGAIGSGSIDMVTWLLANGADDLTVTNFQNKTLVQVATERGHEDIVALLKAHGAE